MKVTVTRLEPSYPINRDVTIRNYVISIEESNKEFYHKNKEEITALIVEAYKTSARRVAEARLEDLVKND